MIYIIKSILYNALWIFPYSYISYFKSEKWVVPEKIRTHSPMEEICNVRGGSKIYFRHPKGGGGGEMRIQQRVKMIMFLEKVVS